jgi:DNA-directed RNA polymerases I, II, and III subunit RPABC2
LVEELDNKYIDNNINDIKPENVTEPPIKEPSKTAKKNPSPKVEAKITKSRSKSKKTKTTTTTSVAKVRSKKEEKETGEGEEEAKTETKEEIEQESLRKEKFVEYEEPDYILREITTQDQQILIGPKRLTRFEKARITGARSLQISFGAPLMIKVDIKTRSSISLAIEELEKKALPISIRRLLPNGVYQDVPIIWLKI